MNYFIRFIESDEFGISVAIISVIVAATELALKKIGKIPQTVANYLPLIIAAVCSVAKDLILSGKATFNQDLLYGALTAYSIGTVISVSISKLIRGEKADDALLALINSLAKRVCRENSQSEFAKIAEILSLANDFDSVKNQVIALLESVKKEDVKDEDITTVAETILLSAQKLKKEK